MGLFSKKLTPTQETELQEFATTLRAVREQCEQSWIDTRSHCNALVAIGSYAQEQDRGLQAVEHLVDIVVTGYRRYRYIVQEKTVDTEGLIEEAQDAIQRYKGFLIEMQAKVSFFKPANWYPKKHRKAHDSWDLYFDLRLKILEATTDALQPPEPLKRDPIHGNNKLNAFISTLNEIARFSQEMFLPKDI